MNARYQIPLSALPPHVRDAYLIIDATLHKGTRWADNYVTILRDKSYKYFKFVAGDDRELAQVRLKSYNAFCLERLDEILQRYVRFVNYEHTHLFWWVPGSLVTIDVTTLIPIPDKVCIKYSCAATSEETIDDMKKQANDYVLWLDHVTQSAKDFNVEEKDDEDKN